MTAFVTLSVAIAIATVAVTGVVVVRLARAARHMARDVSASADRLRPLASELSDELAVTQTELERLQARASRLSQGEGQDG